MAALIGIRREDKSRWERRVPLIPEHVKELMEKHGFETWIQPSKIRIFSDDEYIKIGAKVEEDLSPVPIIFALKEIPVSFFEPKKTYVFFSHTIKGQPSNMPMLKRMLDLKCNLIDYEKITNEQNRRLIFFGNYAGYAGMIDTLWALGQRLNWEGISNPFSKILQAYQYKSLAEAKEEISRIGNEIKTDGLPEPLVPFVCGFAGYGNVSQGAQEIFNLLPTQEIKPEALASFIQSSDYSSNFVYKVVFKEEHMVEPISLDKKFKLQDYYDNPDNYRSRFETYVPYLTLLVNGIYWDSRYPRLVIKEYLKTLYSKGSTPHLRVIGDISCDIAGSIECTVKITDPDNPVYVYNPLENKVIDGYKGLGPVILARDNLPCELSRESSIYFSQILKQFVPDIVAANFSANFDQCYLPQSIKNAVLVYHGKLTPSYKHLTKFL